MRNNNKISKKARDAVLKLISRAFSLITAVSLLHIEH